MKKNILKRIKTSITSLIDKHTLKATQKSMMLYILFVYMYFKTLSQILPKSDQQSSSDNQQ